MATHVNSKIDNRVSKATDNRVSKVSKATISPVVTGDSRNRASPSHRSPATKHKRYRDTRV